MLKQFINQHRQFVIFPWALELRSNGAQGDPSIWN